jgi:hypothetical protein
MVATVKLTVVLDYYEAMETYSRIGLLRSYGNLQSYWTTTKLWKLTVVLNSRCLEFSNNVFTFVFTLELLVKVISSGVLFGKTPYLTNFWNILGSSIRL